VRAAAQGAFVAVAAALLELAEQRLYKLVGEASFSAYARRHGQQQLGLGRRHACALLAAARVWRALPESLAQPTSERQLRPLVGCDDATAAAAWTAATAAAVGCAWFAGVYGWPHAFLSQRVGFLRAGQGGGDNPHGTVAVYLGPNVRRFCAEFGGVAYVPGHNGAAGALRRPGTG
jgi:hypothetical protein